MFFGQFRAFTAFGALNFHTISLILFMAAADVILRGGNSAFFQHFENWTLQNLLKMGVSAASCKSKGGPLASFSDQIWPR